MERLRLNDAALLIADYCRQIPTEGHFLYLLSSLSPTSYKYAVIEKNILYHFVEESWDFTQRVTLKYIAKTSCCHKNSGFCKFKMQS